MFKIQYIARKYKLYFLLIAWNQRKYNIDIQENKHNNDMETD